MLTRGFYKLKKIIPLAIVGILVLSGLGASGGTVSENENLISETIVFSEPVVSEKEDYVSVELEEATSYLWQTGKPTLPVISKVYTFPLGTSIDNVEVIFSDTIEKEISKPVKLSPEVYPETVEYINIKTTEKEISYSGIDIYPEQRYSYRTGAGLNNGERAILLVVSIRPVQYKRRLYTTRNTCYFSR
jgi:hypothetical protein